VENCVTKFIEGGKQPTWTHKIDYYYY